ncbi:MAG: tryptophan synthase subunit alpha [Pseudomonadota bacterium]
MVSKITSGFEKASKANKAAYIPFIMGGFPDRGTFVSLLKTLDDGGADIIEVGIPFSDPLADGPTIQKAGQMALEQGANLANIIQTLREEDLLLRAPVVLMSYWNPILRMGIEKFGSKTKASNVSGVIIPDLPPEEAGQWIEIAETYGIDTIFMVAPTTTATRLESIVNSCKGFVYVVSMTGVTGSELVVGQELLDTIANVKRISSLPVAVGFGVSNPDQAAALSDVADGVIVGSALIKKCLEAPDGMSAIKAVSDLSLGIVERLGKSQAAGHA